MNLALAAVVGVFAAAFTSELLNHGQQSLRDQVQDALRGFQRGFAQGLRRVPRAAQGARVERG